MLGMWLAAFVFTPVAFLFTRAAILDKKIIWKSWLSAINPLTPS
jgi:hypothetical protein